MQLFAGAHGHAVSSGKLEFADNVHNVAVHARAVGAMHARAQPLLHGTHSPMAFGRPFGDRLAYSHTNAEAMMHYPSSLPLDQSPHHARPTHHPDVLPTPAKHAKHAKHADTRYRNGVTFGTPCPMRVVS